ncbi:hypothetical protein GTB64_004538 [Salmonella enterica]|nr:hypothetical protein [Salmonella enterica]
MDNAPVTTGERLEWLAAQCTVFHFQMNKSGYLVIARKGDDRYYESAGPVCDMTDAVDEAFYEVLQDKG